MNTKINEENIKNEIKNKIAELDCDLWDLERHFVFDDREVYQYLEENEYDINTDDLGLFQKFWIKTRNYTKSLEVRFGKPIIQEIFEEIKLERLK